MNKKMIITTMLTFVVLFFLPNIAIAEEQTIPYSVSPIIPESQKEESVSYFDIQLKPNQKETLKLLVKNSSDKEIRVKIKPNTAKTSESGTIDYSGSKEKLAKTLPVDFETIISEEQEVTISAKSQKEVSFEIKMPNQSFSGSILGGFYINEIKESNQQKTESENGVQINNDYAFVVGTKITQKKEIVEPAFKLDNINVDKWNERYTLNIQLVNDAPKIMSNMTLDTQIYQGDKQVKIFETRSFSMAPNSIFNLHEVVSPSELPKGTYLLKTVIHKDDKTYKLEKEFTVSAEDSKNASSEVLNAEKQESNQFLLLIIAGLIGLLAVLLIVIIYTRKNKK